MDHDWSSENVRLANRVSGAWRTQKCEGEEGRVPTGVLCIESVPSHEVTAGWRKGRQKTVVPKRR